MDDASLLTKNTLIEESDVEKIAENKHPIDIFIRSNPVKLEFGCRTENKTF